MPGIYVPTEQLVQDKAEYARKGIARGRSLIGCSCNDGLLICAENASRTPHKVSEIYDRIGFGGVGRYNEFDQLRIAGVRHADLKGFTYSREDVDSRGLANQYAQLLGTIFTHEMKPMEVEILVGEVGADLAGDRLFHIRYDGTVDDRIGFSVLGGDADALSTRMEAGFEAEVDLGPALRHAVAALSGPDRQLVGSELEVAILRRHATGRTFRRLEGEELASLLT